MHRRNGPTRRRLERSGVQRGTPPLLIAERSCTPRSYSNGTAGCSDCTSTLSDTVWLLLSRAVIVFDVASTATVATNDRPPPLADAAPLMVTVAVERSSVCSNDAMPGSNSGGSVMRETIPSLKSEVSDAIAVAMFTRNETEFGSAKPPRPPGVGAGGTGLGGGRMGGQWTIGHHQRESDRKQRPAKGGLVHASKGRRVGE